MAVLGGAITIATVQVFRGASFNQATLSPSAGQFKQAGEAIGTSQTYSESADTFGRLTPIPTIKYAIVATNGNVEFSGSSQVTSDPSDPNKGGVYANGNVVLSGSADVLADVTATGTITGVSPPGRTIIGMQRQNYTPPVIFQTVAEIDALANGYKAEAQAGGTFNGDKTINGGSVNLGPLYINGDLEIKGNATVTLTGTVYIKGEVEMQGSSKVQGAFTLVTEEEIELRGNGRLTPANIPIIMSLAGHDEGDDEGDDEGEHEGDEGDDEEEVITCSGNTEISAVLYAPYGKIKLGASSNLYGSAVAKRIESSGSSVIYPFVN